MEFEYKKSLGQNFIYDVDFLRSITEKLSIRPQDYLVEVGAGAGTLTKVLSGYGCHVRSIEIDQRLAPILKSRLQDCPRVEIVFGDALKQDYQTLPMFRLVANVPYYITTPLLMHFLALPNCQDINILVADEVAKRIVAKVGTAEYGALSVACQLQAQCEIIKTVPRTMFTPQPKVDSAFVRIIKNTAAVCDDVMARMLKSIFAARRKTMLNAMTNVLNDKAMAKTILEQAGINPEVRPEQVTPTEYAKIRALLPNFA